MNYVKTGRGNERKPLRCVCATGTLLCDDQQSCPVTPETQSGCPFPVRGTDSTGVRASASLTLPPTYLLVF